MKFKKFSKALLMGALSAGVAFGITSCIQSYTVGYLYVTSTVTAQPSGNGLITGFKIEHNTGKLTTINGLPVSSGGANPVRAILTNGSRFVYVLNRGTTASGSASCTTASPCQNANITQFSVGGNGVLTPQQTFYTQGVNPFRILADTSGNYLMVLDHDAPDNYVSTYNASTNGCTLALGSGVKTCGDITVFKIDQTTGRLSLVPNAQVTTASGAQLNYFPVPANPVDFVMASTSTVLTLTGSSVQSTFPYTGGTSVFPYSYTSTTGQLTLSQNSAQPLGITAGTAIVNAYGTIYVLDNEAPSPNPNGASSQILPFTVGNNGALQAQSGGAVPIDPTLSNPTYVMVSSKQNFLYVTNQGNNTAGTNANSGISAFSLYTSPTFKLVPMDPPTFGSGAGPQCIVEDPSNQYVFEANEYDSSVTGRTLDPVSGNLDGMRVTSTYSLKGPATWCFMDGRTG